MFPITSKVKIAAGIAAGVLTLGAAGAYAANANNTITTFPLGGTTGSLSHGGQSLSLVSLKQNQTLTLPTTPFKNEGQCVSFFATNKTLALAPTTGNTVKKNFHGKLMSSDSLKGFCATFQTAKGTADSADNPTSTVEQPEAADTDTSDSADLPSAKSHAHGND